MTNQLKPLWDLVKELDDLINLQHRLPRTGELNKVVAKLSKALQEQEEGKVLVEKKDMENILNNLDGHYLRKAIRKKYLPKFKEIL